MGYGKISPIKALSVKRLNSALKKGSSLTDKRAKSNNLLLTGDIQTKKNQQSSGVRGYSYVNRRKAGITVLVADKADVIAKGSTISKVIT